MGKLLAVAGMAIALASCQQIEPTPQQPKQDNAWRDVNGIDIQVFTDDETGCEYLVLRYGAPAIHARLGPDGKPICRPDNAP